MSPIVKLSLRHYTSFSFVAMVAANIGPVNGDSGLMQSSLSFVTPCGTMMRDIAHTRRTYNGSEEASEEASEEDGEG